ncbi:MAG TPA: Nif3-like dinuclear metal center hexameric protein, partial [Armatimonadota bacterium]|nr:Nif3-like dinuclear metal center hexameric protein [Armatimonadota bacterium]
QQTVTGVGTTFLLTVAVIERAITQGINFIITHEPTFYNHRDETEWLHDDPCYQAKRRLLDEHHIAVWRFHDGLHALQPDPIFVGLAKRLGWHDSMLPDDPYVCQSLSRSLHELVDEVKTQLGLPTVRVVGDLTMPCTKAGLLIGACGGTAQITMLARPDIDLLICGEINEWETNIYVRDAMDLGQRKALVVIGHAASEEPGMDEILPWLQARLPGLPITFLPTEQPFQWR